MSADVENLDLDDLQQAYSQILSGAKPNGKSF